MVLLHCVEGLTEYEAHDVLFSFQRYVLKDTQNGVNN